MSAPARGERFFHPRFAGGAIVTVKATGRGGRWGRGYVAWKFEPIDGHAPGFAHRTTGLHLWPAFAAQMVPIKPCPLCIGSGASAFDMPPARCEFCDGKGFVEEKPAPVDPTT
jgi:hypothetical protein